MAVFKRHVLFPVDVLVDTVARCNDVLVGTVGCILTGGAVDEMVFNDEEVQLCVSRRDIVLGARHMLL